MTTPDTHPSPAPSEAALACRSGGEILAATRELLAERGVEGLTVDGVAARAKVGKATIYRHWRSRAELVMDAVASVPGPERPVLVGEVHADLCAVFGALGEVLSDPERSRLLATLVDAAERDPELAELHVHHSNSRRAPARAVLAEAVERGELAPATDLDLAVDLIAGPLFYRRLLTHQPVTPAVVEAVVDAVLVGLRPAR